MFSGQMITEDQRGKHGKHAKIDDKIKDGARAHINSIPRIPSHYCRAGSSREYIEVGKSLADLHRDYVDTCKKNNEAFVNYMMYSRIFNHEFNVSFFIPKKDQCDLCVEYSNSKPEEKLKLKLDVKIT
ncbi:hypothetical protein NQ314_018684 [Rhamnusium bicolor]|uniref:Uncharacterized protein n=1 Tax=Rhamnusium bicolor TaxID=1586634 RepID=A0AAV8WPQ3_9CUCU|nr:hypothetical protein NQ314_018684 [Rhamnusium bicolor]